MKKLLALVLTLLMLVQAIPAVSAADSGKSVYKEAELSLIDEYIQKAFERKAEILASETDITYSGTAYYVSSSGSDKNDGLTPETAWKTIERINSASLKHGDAVLFKRGEKFRTTVPLMTAEGVTYSTYGSGSKPVIVGSVDASYKSDWKETEYENVYEYKDKLDGKTRDVGVIVFDYGKAWGIKLNNSVSVGVVSNGLETYDVGIARVINAGDLKHDLEFWHDWNTGSIFLYSRDGNPAERFASVELVDYGHGITGKANNVTIDNLAFFGIGSHAIGYSGLGDNTPKNLTVQNCAFSFIGGSVQTMAASGPIRFGNAVEIFGACDGFRIINCYADNLYDCCWTIQYQGSGDGNEVWFKDVEFANNVAMYSNTGNEIWLSNNGGSGKTFGMKNISVHDNYTLFSGYGWSHQRPNKNGNIFYGAGGQNLVYENCSNNNNVGMFTSAFLNLLRYPGTQHYNFNHNIYFQNTDVWYGGVPENPETGTGVMSSVPDANSHKYDRATMEKLIATGFEPGSTYYYPESHFDVPQYTPDSLGFNDLSESHWAYKNIERAGWRGYFNGTSETTFSPELSMTRAMLAAVLSRLADFDTDKTAAPLTDVNRSAWYAQYADFAYNAGLVDKSKTTFRPDAAATREELCDMLYRFMLARNKTGEIAEPNLEFSDKAQVSAEYAAGVAFAVRSGIVSGYTDGSVKPKNTATRAEVATMLCRFAELYRTSKTTFDTGKTDSIVLSADELYKCTTVANGDKRLDDSGSVNLLSMSVKTKTYSPASLTVYERLAKIDFADYPYIRVRSRTSSGGTMYEYKLTRGSVSKTLSAPSVLDEWTNTIYCIYDMIPIDEYSAAEGNSTFTLSPWSGLDVNTFPYNSDTFDVEYIGFFPTYEAAEAYMSAFEAASAKVTFKNGDETFLIKQFARGEALTYPTNIPTKNGYAFKGWSLPEGTLINEDTIVNAVFERAAGQPIAFFDPDNSTPAVSGGLGKSIETENGIKYYHFTVPNDGKSVDGTRTSMVFTNADYDASEHHFVKFAYRTNVASSDAIDLNIWFAANSRLWGPRVNYAAKDKWCETVIDLSKLSYSGGEGIEKGLDAAGLFKNYVKGNLYSFMFKPYSAVGLEMKAGEYFDLAYVAFFATEEDAKAFTYFNN